MYTSWIERAYQAGDEFVTAADLAARIQSFAQSGVTSTVNGNVVSVTVTSAHAGDFALDIAGQGSQVIANVANWYAYDSDSLFLPETGGNFTITLGAAADDVTHITALPMRGDLLSLAGNGVNLSFSMLGEGEVTVHLAGSVAGRTPILTGAGATSAGQTGNDLRIQLTGLGQHDVSIRMQAPPPAELVASLAFSADTGASSTDLVTSVAAQTVTGTLSGPLAAGDIVQVSLDAGKTWLKASAAVGVTNFTLSGVVLTGGGTIMGRVVNADGVANTALVVGLRARPDRARGDGRHRGDDRRQRRCR